MSKIKILIVEDDKTTAANLTSILKSKKYSITGIADTGNKAIKIVKETAPDIVLMDIELKGKMDGTEAAEKIQKNFNIPVIYLTVHAAGGFLTRAKETEPYGFIEKPGKEK